MPTVELHQKRDLEKVRRIRNELERRGHNPLLFSLKCLEADDACRPEPIRDETRHLAHDRNRMLEFRP
jgi:hypothetical protein